MKILFLDFDGVLHPAGAGGARFTRLPLLESLLREPGLQDVKIVISSTWREAHSLNSLRGFFSADIAGRVAGCTPVLDDYESDFRRAEEIEAWLASRPAIPRWMALDDDQQGFPPRLKSRVVITDRLTGLTEGGVALLRSALS